MDGFASAWEHARILSDAPRNAVIHELMRRHASGHRVLEVGCGPGLWCCVAARLGARRVIGVEPTEQAALALQLVADNGLLDTVHIVQDTIEALDPEPVDLAFSELLNADPFIEGIVPAMAAARRWVVEGGVLAPSRVRVFAALCPAEEGAQEMAAASQEIRRLAQALDLRLDPLLEALRTDEVYRYLAPVVQPLTEPVRVADLVAGAEPHISDSISILATTPIEAAGAVLWFEADYPSGVLHNRPGTPSHWGNLVCGWSRAVRLTPGDTLELAVELDEDELTVLAP